MKRVLCLEDLACVGRCSLAAALPVISASGVQACCVPTGLFSTHTAGFGAPARAATDDFARAALEHYRSLGLSFDAVLSGYLAGEGQAELVRETFAQNPDALHVVDPAMADGGKMYASLPPQLLPAMASLCEEADVLLPNVTESELLLGLTPTGQAGSEERARERAAALLERFPRAGLIVITGWGSRNVCAQRGRDAVCLPFERVETSYHGTGDVFAAALTAALARGDEPLSAVRRTARFLTAAAAAAEKAGAEPRHGVWYETCLTMLTEREET